MNTVDYTKTIDCGLCHERVYKGDRPKIQGRSKNGAIFYWPAYLHKDCMDSRGKISMKHIEIVIHTLKGLKLN